MMKKYNPLYTAIVVLILGIGISFLVQQKRNKEQLHSKSREIDLTIDNKVQIILTKLTADFSSIELVRFLFEKGTTISRQEFQDFTHPIFRGNNSIKAISWVPKITNSARAGFESVIGEEFLNPKISITQQNSKYKLITAGNRDYYFPIKYIEPFEENIAALGYDIYSAESRQATINKAIRENKLCVTPRIKLVQDTTGNSFLGVIPVYNTVESNRSRIKIQNVKGIISAVFKVDQLINNALAVTQSGRAELWIFDVTGNSKDLIYGHEQLLKTKHQIYKRPLHVGGRDWELNFAVNPAFYQIDDSFNYFLVGLSASFLLFCYCCSLLSEKKEAVY